MACPNTMDVKGKLSSWKSYTARYLDIDAKAYHLVLGRRESLRDGQGGGGGEQDLETAEMARPRQERLESL